MPNKKERPEAYVCLRVHDRRRRPLCTQEILGHKSITMTPRYAHLSPAYKSKMLGVMDQVWNAAPAVETGSSPPTLITDGTVNSFQGVTSKASGAIQQGCPTKAPLRGRKQLAFLISCIQSSSGRAATGLAERSRIPFLNRCGSNWRVSLVCEQIRQGYRHSHDIGRLPALWSPDSSSETAAVPRNSSGIASLRRQIAHVQRAFFGIERAK